MKFPISSYANVFFAGLIYSVLGGFIGQLEELGAAFCRDAEAGLDYLVLLMLVDG